MLWEKSIKSVTRQTVTHLLNGDRRCRIVVFE